MQVIYHALVVIKVSFYIQMENAIESVDQEDILVLSIQNAENVLKDVEIVNIIINAHPVINLISYKDIIVLKGAGLFIITMINNQINA